MKQWWRQPLVVAANLPLIIAALRWNWLTGLRMVGQTPARWDLDAEIMWLLVAAACFGLNVYNLIIVYQQPEAVVQQPRYRQASWAFALLLMAGLVVCWAQPENLINPHKLTWVLILATAIVTIQALVGNYFLRATENDDESLPSLAIPTLTWLVAALLGWPRQLTAGQYHFTIIVLMIILVAIVLFWQAENLKLILASATMDGNRLYQFAEGVAVASWLSAVIVGLFRCWLILTQGWPGLINLVLAINLLLLAAATQLLAMMVRKLPGGDGHRVNGLLILGAVAAVFVELGVAAATFA